MRSQSARVGGYALIAVGSALCGAVAPAQAQEVSAPGDDTIIVTAQKREESIQDIPISITAFTASDIERSGISNLSDVASLTPGFNFVTLLGSTSATPVIRGQSTLIGEPNVGIFVDGVYQSSRAAMDGLLADVERIEVVKGPQSALYGRNTFGGAINYILRQPSDHLTGRLEATAGSLERAGMSGALSGPLARDDLLFRISATYRRRGGYYTNLLTGEDLDERETTAAYASLRFRPNDNLSFQVTGTLEDTDNGDTAQLFIRNNAGFFPSRQANQTYVGRLPEITDGFAVTPGHFRRNNHLLSLQSRWENDNIEVVSISAGNWLDVDSAADNDYEARDIHYRTDVIEQKDLSQELRVQSNGDGPLSWILGSYFYKLDYESDSTDEFVGLGAGFGGQRVVLDDGTRNFAVFGKAAIELVDGLTLDLSARYSREKKTTHILEFDTATGQQITDLSLADEFNSFTPRISVSYKPDEDTLLYASAARAVKSGGFNNTNLSGPVLPDERTYDSERSWNYEVGVRTSWADGRLVANSSAFYIEWKDQIVRDLGQAGAILNSNAGRTTSKGFELALSARPTEGLNLSANYAYTDARYEDYQFPALEALLGLDADQSGNRLQFYPTHAVTLSGDYAAAIDGDWEWYVRADYSLQSEIETASTNDSYYSGISRFNARIGVQNERYSISLWARNLFGDDALGNGVLTTPYGQRYDFIVGTDPGVEVLAPLLTAGEPRQLGVTASVRF